MNCPARRSALTRLVIGLALVFGTLIVAHPAFASTAGPAQTGALNRAMSTIASDGRPLSLSLQILILMSLLTVLPSLVLMMTSFTRIIIVLSLLRQALGLQQTPPNQVLVGLENQQITALGNGVLPLQAVSALSLLDALTWTMREARPPALPVWFPERRAGGSGFAACAARRTT
jgi:hypothetical protein